jgi:hypothetical protein
MDDTRGDPAAEEGDFSGGETLPPTIVGFGLGAVVGMVLVGLVWLGVASLTGSSVPVAKEDVGSPVGLNLSASPEPQDQRPTPLERCRTADSRVTPALHAADPAISQWEVHVGAMNKLVVGAISLQQATDFWNQTRLLARHNVRVFQAAAHRAARHAVRCRAPGPAAGPMPAQLRSCSRRVAADRRALDAARAAIGTWARHVTDMDMLRIGKLTPTKATQMWLASWKAGVRQLQAYHGAVRTARSSGTC